MFGCVVIARSAWGIRSDKFMECTQTKQAHLDFLEPGALVPAALPLLFHALDGDKPLVRVLRAGTGTGLHRGNRGIGR